MPVVPPEKTCLASIGGANVRCWFFVALLATAAAHGDSAPQPAAGGSPTARTEAGAAASPQFDVWEYQVFGNSVLEQDSIQRTVYPFLGPGKSLDEVEKARRTLEETYHKAGYQTVFVNIPEQDVVDGVVKLEVTEGKVARMKVTGSRYFSLGHIRERVPELAAGKVPNMPTVQTQMTQLAQENSDRQVTPVLRVGDKPGTMEAEIKVKDQLPLHGSVEMNGRNTVGTSYSRLLATLRYDNLWQLNHSASLQYLVAPQEQDVEVWSGTYAMPLFDNSVRLAFYGIGIYSTANTVAAAGAQGVLGSGNVYGLRLSKVLEPFDNFFHSVTVGWDYKDFTQSVTPLSSNGGDIPSQIGSGAITSPITYNPFMVGYSGGFRGEDSMTSFGFEGRFSIRGLGNDQKEFEERRYLAQSNYFYFTGEVRHQHKLPGDVGLVVRANGQVANSPLINNEQLSAGGMYSVRGYHETQELADSGVIGSLEIHSPRLVPDDWEMIGDTRAVTFIDGAQLWNQEALPGTPSEVSMAGAGLGLRLDAWRHLLGEFYWAYPFIRAGNVGAGNQRIHFRLAYEF